MSRAHTHHLIIRAKRPSQRARSGCCACRGYQVGPAPALDNRRSTSRPGHNADPMHRRGGGGALRARVTSSTDSFPITSPRQTRWLTPAPCIPLSSRRCVRWSCAELDRDPREHLGRCGQCWTRAVNRADASPFTVGSIRNSSLSPSRPFRRIKAAFGSHGDVGAPVRPGPLVASRAGEARGWPGVPHPNEGGYS